MRAIVDKGALWTVQFGQMQETPAGMFRRGPPFMSGDP
jgi:hypothetical protein